MPLATYQAQEPRQLISSEKLPVALRVPLQTGAQTGPMAPETSNLFLSGLSPECLDTLLPKCVAVELPSKATLYGAEETTRYAYFITSGLASVVISMTDGGTAEVGFIGREGIAGSLQLLGPEPLSTKCVMQLAGRGLQIRFTVLQDAFDSSEEIRKRILEFVQEQTMTLGQIAGCNRLHSAEERLVRWLLMAQDRTHGDVLRFTHEELGAMIGARRTTVTVLAGELQARGLISYSRGRVSILDRVGLEAITCSCYAIAKRSYANLYSRNQQHSKGQFQHAGH